MLGIISCHLDSRLTGDVGIWACVGGDYFMMIDVGCGILIVGGPIPRAKDAGLYKMEGDKTDSNVHSSPGSPTVGAM